MRITTIAKITRPVVRNVVQRKRLFALLNGVGDRQTIWITSPPGSGKTTLVASWLDDRKLPDIWYQVDAGDSDISTFFYYMGLAAGKAAPRYKDSLPFLTSEYLHGIPAFSRRFFEKLCERLAPYASRSLRKQGMPGFAVVLDNFQDADHPAFHEMLSHGLEAIPPGIVVIVASRKGPPPPFARLRANGRMSVLAWDEVRFTAEESQDLLRIKKRGGLSRKLVGKLHEKAEGWAAGLVLLSESTDENIYKADLPTKTPQHLFDYFAAEIFKDTDNETREFLLKTSFLPSVTIEMAEQLTGITHASQILLRLSQEHYFTDAGKGVNPFFRYHPLFIEFLQSRARDEFKELELLDILGKAAFLLADEGRMEDSARLFLEIQDWEGFIRLILSNALNFIAQGRHKTLEEWILAIPEEKRKNTPWLLYWLGVCRMPFNPRESRRLFEKAFGLFAAGQDHKGMFLAWANIVDTFIYEYGDFPPLDHWLDVIDKLLADHPAFPDPDVEVRVISSIQKAMSWRQPNHKDLPMWVDRLWRIVMKHRSVSLRIGVGGFLVRYYLFIGDFHKSFLMMDALRPLSRSKECDTLARQNWYVGEAMHSWIIADHATCMKIVSEGLRNSQETGVHLLDLALLANGAYSGQSLGQPMEAAACVEKMAQINSPRLLDKASYHYHAASVAWGRGDIKKGIEHGKLAVSIAEEVGSPLPLSLCFIDLAVTLFDVGEYEEAEKHLARARDLVPGANFIQYICHLHGAGFAFRRGDEDKGVALLREGLALGSRQGYLNIPRWKDETMSRLCAKALEHEIETEYTRMLIRKRGLVPATDAGGRQDNAPLPRNWPYPLRIYTLERFEIIKDGKPLVFSGKAPKKPLEMLKTLIALGGKDISEEGLADALWPDADGDLAHQSFATTLKRLRELLGGKDAIRLSGGLVSINPAYCWVDVLSPKN